MWNPFKNRKNKRLLRELNQLSTQFAILDEFARRGLLYWKKSDKTLLIEESLATLKLAEGTEKFQHFLEQVSMWQNYNLINDAYEVHRMNVETEAVHKALKDNANLTNSDIYRLRQLARTTMSEINIDDLDIVKEFDIFVLRSTAVSARQATEENGQLLAVGHFDGSNVEMAMYDDVKSTLFQNSDEA